LSPKSTAFTAHFGLKFGACLASIQTSPTPSTQHSCHGLSPHPKHPAGQPAPGISAAAVNGPARRAGRRRFCRCADALGSVSAAQGESGRLQQAMQLEDPTVTLEQTMVAIQKAQIGFQATLHVRNRMVQAYTDIMNMQV